MAVLLRWCICPVITEWQHPPEDWLDSNGDLLPGQRGGWWLRRPKASLIVDPGRPANQAMKPHPITGELEPVVDDQGNPVMIPKVVTHSSVLTNGPATPPFTVAPPPLIEAPDDKWCLSLCCAVDFAELEKEVDIEDVLDEIYPHADHPVFLNNTPRLRNWNAARIDKVKGVMSARGKMSDGDIEAKMTEDTPFKSALFEIAKGTNPQFDATQMNTSIKE